MSRRPTTGMLRASSPRAADWLRVFGGLEVPLCSPVAVWARLPGRIAEVYRVDVGRLTADQIERAVAHLAERFGRPADEVRADLLNPEHGLPLLASEVLVSFDVRLAL